MIDNRAGGVKGCKDGVEDLHLIIGRNIVASILLELRIEFLESGKIFLCSMMPRTNKEHGVGNCGGYKTCL